MILVFSQLHKKTNIIKYNTPFQLRGEESWWNVASILENTRHLVTYSLLLSRAVVRWNVSSRAVDSGVPGPDLQSLAGRDYSARCLRGNDPDDECQVVDLSVVMSLDSSRG